MACTCDVIPSPLTFTNNFEVIISYQTKHVIGNKLTNRFILIISLTE